MYINLLYLKVSALAYTTGCSTHHCFSLNKRFVRAECAQVCLLEGSIISSVWLLIKGYSSWTYPSAVRIVETRSSTFSGRMNDLMMLCYLPSCVWSQTVFYNLGVSDPVWLITVESVLFPSAPFTAVIVKFYFTALSQRGCLKLNCKLIVSCCCSHNLIVVFCAFDSALFSVHGWGLFILNSS